MFALQDESQSDSSALRRSTPKVRLQRWDRHQMANQPFCMARSSKHQSLQVTSHKRDKPRFTCASRRGREMSARTPDELWENDRAQARGAHWIWGRASSRRPPRRMQSWCRLCYWLSATTPNYAMYDGRHRVARRTQRKSLQLSRCA